MNLVRVLAFEPIPNQVRLRDYAILDIRLRLKLRHAMKVIIRVKLVPPRFRYQKLASLKKSPENNADFSKVKSSLEVAILDKNC